MSDLSNYLENALYNHVFRNITFTSPTTVFVRLFTAVTDAEAATGTECAATGYSGQAVTMGAPTNGAGSNSGGVTFGPLTGTVAPITHAALFDAASGGNPLTAIKALAGGTITYASGDSVNISAGQLSATFA